MWFDMKVSGGKPWIANAADHERAGGGIRRVGSALGLLVSSITILRQSSAPFPASASPAAMLHRTTKSRSKGFNDHK